MWLSSIGLKLSFLFFFNGSAYLIISIVNKIRFCKECLLVFRGNHCCQISCIEKAQVWVLQPGNQQEDRKIWHFAQWHRTCATCSTWRQRPWWSSSHFTSPLTGLYAKLGLCASLADNQAGSVTPLVTGMVMALGICSLYAVNCDKSCVSNMTCCRLKMHSNIPSRVLTGISLNSWIWYQVSDIQLKISREQFYITTNTYVSFASKIWPVLQHWKQPRLSFPASQKIVVSIEIAKIKIKCLKLYFSSRASSTESEPIDDNSAFPYHLSVL